METKLLLNINIYDAHKGARFLSLNIKDVFLQTYMKRAEYMGTYSKDFLADIREKYNIDELITDNGYVYWQIKKVIYGLKQAARLAYDTLVTNLKKEVYIPDKCCSNIWNHETRQTEFYQCVDDFGVTYFSRADADYLIQTSQKNYIINVDW